MVAALGRRLADLLFSERQILWRSRGRVLFMPLPGAVVVALAVLGMAVIGWGGYATGGFFAARQTVDVQAARIVQLEGDYGELARSSAARLAATSQASAEALAALDARHRSTIRALSEELKSALTQIADLDRELEARDLAMTTLGSEKAFLEERLGTLAHSLQAIKLPPDAPAPLAALSRDDAGEASADELADRLAAVQLALEHALFQRAALGAELREVRHRLATITAERNAHMRSRQEASRRLDHMLGQVSLLQHEQRDFVDRLLKRTAMEVADLEATIAKTGLDVDALLDAAGVPEAAKGGPLVGPAAALNVSMPYPASATAPDERYWLEVRLARWEGLQDIFQVLPLAVPMDGYYISSGFGDRVDPMTKKAAFHGGLDFVGPARAPVRASAPGVVTFAGRQGPFGNLVEISHGHGLTTRYAHLHDIAVEEGQAVKFREVVGRVGSTGRSTGNHLHYEISLNGNALDPARFIEAGRHVFKN